MMLLTQRRAPQPCVHHTTGWLCTRRLRPHAPTNIYLRAAAVKQPAPSSLASRARDHASRGLSHQAADQAPTRAQPEPSPAVSVVIIIIISA